MAWVCVSGDSPCFQKFLKPSQPRRGRKKDGWADPLLREFWQRFEKPYFATSYPRSIGYERSSQHIAKTEAKAMGVPVVAVGAEGVLEGVVDGQTGYLVAPKDFQALAARALELLKDEEKRRRFSLEARAWAMERSAERIAEKIVAVYDEANEIVRVEPRRLIFPFPRLPQSSLEDHPGGF